MIPFALNREVRLKSKEEIIHVSCKVLNTSKETIELLLKVGFPFQRLKLICAISELKGALVYDIPMKDKYKYIAELYGYSISSVRQFHRNYSNIYKSVEGDGKNIQ